LSHPDHIPIATLIVTMDVLQGCRLLSAASPSTLDAATVLEGKTVGLYFSAHWCPPCRQFTPQLARVYTELRNKDIAFEIVFVSLDRSVEQYRGYLSGMPWIAVQFEQQQEREELAHHYGVQGIPTLVILDSQGQVITRAGVAGVREQGAEGFPWSNASEGTGCSIV
jgi:nucleoredoxin